LIQDEAGLDSIVAHRDARSEFFGSTPEEDVVGSGNIKSETARLVRLHLEGRRPQRMRRTAASTATALDVFAKCHSTATRPTGQPQHEQYGRDEKRY
jgi:hypothetical protein